MIEHPFRALARALRLRLQTGSPSYADRVHLESAPATSVRPYVIYRLMGGGERNQTDAPDPELLLLVKCVADDAGAALTGAAELADRLDDSGQQDGRAAVWETGGTWQVATVTREQAIFYQEKVSNVSEVYHAGDHYRFRLFQR